jgi:hypothetical protein
MRLWEEEMAAQRLKTLSYRRAQWFSHGAAPDLEKCLRHALAQLKTIEDRTILRDGRSAKVAKADDVPPNGLFLHLATETPGEPASVVPKVAPDVIALDLKTESHPTMARGLMGMLFFTCMRITYACVRLDFMTELSLHL